MPLSSYMSSAANDQPQSLKTIMYHGINQAVDESKLSVKGDCFTPKSVNTWITGGNITVRNNYEEVLPETVTESMNDGYEYNIKKLFVHALPTPGASWLLAICDVLSGGVHDHYALLHRKKNLSNAWAEVKCAASHSLGSLGDSIWFFNADTSFVNYSGMFFSSGGDTYATIMANGVDLPSFYTPSTGLSVLGFDGWKNVTVNPSTNVFAATGLVSSAGETVEFCSRTQQMPGGISPFKIYYARDVSGSTFKLALTEGGSAIDVSSAGANIIGRLNKDYSLWSSVSVNKDTSTFTLAAYAKNGNRVMFSAPSGTLPRGVLSTRAYYVVNASGSTWKVSLTDPDSADGGTPITLQSAGSNVKARLLTQYPADPPRIKNLFMHNDRLWGTRGDTVYHNAGFYDDPDTEQYDGKAHPNDWNIKEFAGNFPLLTWDGDTVQTARVLNGKPWIAKKNTVYTIYGDKPPYTIQPIFTAKGTIAPDSVCWHLSGGLFYATAEGIQTFNGASSAPYLGAEIQRMWCADNDDCVCNIVGDVLYVYGNFYHPETLVKGKGLLAVDLLTKNINYWTLQLGDGTLTVDCILDPRFTILDSDSNVPEFWFASGSMIYKYSLTAPTAGNAVPMTYYEPAQDFGNAMRKKRVSRLALNGTGGTLTVTPVVDGVEKTTKTIELPARPFTPSSANGYRIGFKYASTDDPIQIKDSEKEYA